MSDRAPLSAVLITRDAAAQLDACLASVAFCAEILVVDSGSADGTVAIARARGAKVVDHAWLGYGKQKQFAVAHAAHDWVLCVDADECVSDELRAVIGPSSRPRAASSTRWPAATDSSAAGCGTAKAIPTGASGSSTAATRSGATTRCTRACSPPHRCSGSPATCCTTRPTRWSAISRSRIATRRSRPSASRAKGGRRTRRSSSSRRSCGSSSSTSSGSVSSTACPGWCTSSSGVRTASSSMRS